jgi:hypothetical protein
MNSLLQPTTATPFVQCRTPCGLARPARQQRLVCCASQQQGRQQDIQSMPRVSGFLAGLAAAAVAFHSGPAQAVVRLPPLNDYPDRCELAFTGNTIGQANAVSDKLLDLRQCKLHGADLHGKTLSGGIFVDADLSGSNLQEAVFSKAYAISANFSGADFTNAVVDRVAFDKADLSNTNFTNAVITGTTFVGTNLDGASFEDALVGNEDVKRLCENPTLTGESRLQVGCRVGEKSAADKAKIR